MTGRTPLAKRRPAGDRDALVSELVARAAARLGAARLVAAVADPDGGSGPLVIDGSCVRDDLALPAQALLARFRHAAPGAVTGDDRDRIPPELVGEGDVHVVPLPGMRGLLVATDPSDPAGLEPAAAALSLAIQAASAVEGGRPVSEAGALAAMAETLAGSPQLGRVLTAAARNAAQATGFERCTVLLRSGEQGLLPAASETAAGPAPLAGWRVFADGLGLPAANRAMATAREMAFPNPAATADLRPAAWIGPQGIQRVLIVPLIAWDEAVGVLVLDDTRPAPIDDRDVRIATGLARQAAVGVKAGRILDGLRDSRRHARVVLGAMAHAGAQFSTDGVLTVIADAVHEVSGDATTIVASRGGAFALRGDEAGAGGVLPALLGGDTAGAEGVTALYGDDLAALGSPPPGTARALVMPLRRASQQLGWLVSYGPSARPYRDTDLRIVAALAAQGALSLSTVALLENERTSVNRLEELGRQKTGFVATVSHELRTPLTAIIGFSEILGEWLEEERLRTFVDDVRREAVVLEGIIGNLLDTSRLEAGVLHLDRVQLDLAGLVAESVEVVKHSYPGREISYSVPAGLPAVAGDPVRVRQILVNLLENAAKYSPPGTPITLAVAAGDGAVTVAVEDVGPGIPSEYREQVFDRFFRLEGVHGQPGTGIGLYLVRELTEAHGGSVEIGDGPGGVGCRVEVNLPAGAAA